MDELTLLRDLRDETEPSAAALGVGRARLMEEMTPAVPRRVRVFRRVAVASGIAAAIVAALVIGGAVGVGPESGASVEASAFLEQAALDSITVADPVVGAGQYLRIETKGYGPTQVGPAVDDVYLGHSDATLYVPADRSDEWIWESTPVKATDPFSDYARDRIEEDWAARGGTEYVRAENGEFYGGSIFVDDLDDMPREPAALLKWLNDSYQGGSSSPEEDAMVRIADSLRIGVVPADLRAAMYGALALIPGVSITDDQAVLDGRTGIAIGRIEPKRDWRVDLIIDPDTGAFIGEREVSVRDAWVFEKGDIQSWTSVETSVVDEAP